MLDPGTITERSRIPQITASLWHCSQCNAFVSIRALKVVEEPFCPACAEVALDFCGTMCGIPGLSFGES